ncbi:SET-5 [Neurospora crassa OR74A]|uniref:SET-5 n=1 Tax=Neurospora crassa (strain ATCC 24698 / 74-OR23-1A / CBS 708.71 / DSM 1257 / FGSC 987) TaxID=367110 RepID=Q7S5G9_NEUCR|nr:SET-5 [Neurospora crassa OR74A]EAA30745.1 SET-5 [Neurospora crassa OR74A]|eukprot:XP_959981.1 SET-5 [Neurospora crassa OR74A]
MPPKKTNARNRVTKGGRLGHGPKWTPFKAWNASRTAREIIPGAVCKQVDSFYADPRRWNAAGRPQRPRLSTLPKTEPENESECIADRARAALAEPIDAPEVKYCYTCFECGRNPDDPECSVQCYDELHSGGGSQNGMKTFFKKWLEIRHTGTAEKGYGVFVKTNGRYEIPKGAYLGHYVGEIIPGPTKGYNANNKYLYEPQVGLEWDTDRPIIDAGKMGNWTRFMNSSCDPNVSESIMQIGKVRVIAFFANKTLKSGDELCIYYGDDYFRGHELLCLCDNFEGSHDPTAVGAGLQARERHQQQALALQS